MPSDPNTPPPRVEIITSVQRRGRWSAAEKICLVEENTEPGMSVSLWPDVLVEPPACCSSGGD
jgi:transposase